MRQVRMRIGYVCLLLLSVVLAGCGTTGTPTTVPAPTATVTPGGNMTTGQAKVETIEIRMLESFPVQVHVEVKGYLEDACTKLGEITQKREGNTFTVTVGVTRNGDAVCAQVTTPFTQVVSLDAAGLKAGTYTVNVNGVSAQFTLSVDNVLK